MLDSGRSSQQTAPSLKSPTESHSVRFPLIDLSSETQTTNNNTLATPYEQVASLPTAQNVGSANVAAANSTAKSVRVDHIGFFTQYSLRSSQRQVNPVRSVHLVQYLLCVADSPEITVVRTVEIVIFQKITTHIQKQIQLKQYRLMIFSPDIQIKAQLVSIMDQKLLL